MRKIMGVLVLLGSASSVFSQSAPIMEVVGTIEMINMQSADFIVQEIYYLSNGKRVAAGENAEFACPPVDGHGQAAVSGVSVGERIPMSWTLKIPRKWGFIPKDHVLVTFDLPAGGWARPCGDHLAQINPAFHLSEQRPRSKSLTIAGRKKGKRSGKKVPGWCMKFTEPNKVVDAGSPIVTLRLSWQDEYYIKAMPLELLDIRESEFREASEIALAKQEESRD